MKQLVWRWGPVVAYMAAIFVMSSIPGTQVPLPGLWRYDKVVHAIAFAGLAVLTLRATRRPAIAIGLTTVYGALDELHQRYTPNRSSDPEDLLADFVGACIGTALALLTVRMYVRLRAGGSPRAR